MNEVTIRRIIAGGMFLLPMVLIKVTAFVSGGPAPAQSSAAPVAVVVDPAALITQRKPASEEQLAALRHIEWLGGQSYGDAPLHYDDRTAGPARPKTRASDLVVNAILVTRGVATAIINGQLCRLNDRVGTTGWRVAQIDNATMRVTLKRSAGDEDVTRVISMGN